MKKEAGKAVRMLLPLLCFAGGVLNGFLGTGGGMVLTLSLRAAYPGKEKCALAISTACVLSFSVLTTILYAFEGHLQGLSLRPMLLPALLGGALGAWLLWRIGTLSLRWLFGGLLAYAGLSLLL
ncbi:MAG: TSUP family transporter [Clostridia bacterium]|nr:TSUP family transporter [Clostridia bacterium]